MADVIVDFIAKDDFSGVLGNFGNIMTGLKSTIDLVSGAFSAVADFGSQFTNAAAESEVAVTALNQVLASTGNAAGFTSQQLQDMAVGMQNVSGFSDEAEMSAQAMLLRFENLNDIFPQALQLTNDLAVSLGIDLTSAAQTIGKALDDPASGIGRLNMQFKLFNATQMDTIKQMAENGDVAGAQAIIMDVLKQKVGGAAEAFGNTFSGSLAIAKEKLDNMKETIGGAFLPILQQLLDTFMKFMETNPVIQGVLNFFTKWKDMMDATAPPLAAFGLALYNIETGSQTLNPVLHELGYAFIIISNALASGATPLEAFKKGLDDLAIAWNGTPLEDIITRIQEFISTGESQGWGAAFANLFTDIWNTAWPVIDTALSNIFAAIENKFNLWVAGGGLQAVADKIGDALNTTINSPTFRSQAAAAFLELGNTIMSELGNQMSSSLTSAWDDVVRRWKSYVRQTYWDLKVDLANLGRNIIQGIIDGVNSIEVSVTDWVRDHIVTPIKTFLGIASPSTVFVEIGKNIVQGLINGWDSMFNTFETLVRTALQGLLDNTINPILSAMHLPTIELGGVTTGSIGGGVGGGGGGTGTGTTTGVGGTVVNQYFAGATINVGSWDEIAYDCIYPNPFVAASSGQLTGPMQVPAGAH